MRYALLKYNKVFFYGKNTGWFKYHPVSFFLFVSLCNNVKRNDQSAKASYQKNIHFNHPPNLREYKRKNNCNHRKQCHKKTGPDTTNAYHVRPIAIVESHTWDILSNHTIMNTSDLVFVIVSRQPHFRKETEIGTKYYAL